MPDAIVPYSREKTSGLLVRLKDGREWWFRWDKKFERLIYRTKKTVYGLFFSIGQYEWNKGEIHIWIGRRVPWSANISTPKKKGYTWISWQKEAKAKEIETMTGRFIFK